MDSILPIPGRICEKGSLRVRSRGRSRRGSVTKACLCLVAWVLVLCVPGCKRTEESAAGTEPAPAPEVLGEPVETERPLPPPPPPVAAAAENRLHKGVRGVVDPFLTEQLRIFVKQAGRLPVSFAEFAAQRLDSLPGPPPGHRWVIDAETMTVKAVPTR